MSGIATQPHPKEEDRTSARQEDAVVSPCINAPVRMPECASFDQLARYSRVLFLQGPNGPFFARLRDRLTARDVAVWKVNFNAGDDLYYRGDRVFRYSAPMPGWGEFLQNLVTDLAIQAIVVFGGTRRPHRIAARIAKINGIAYWVFEEGYIRPDYITLEHGGVNADSPLAGLTIDEIPSVPLAGERRSFQHSFRRMAWYSFFYFAAGILGSKRYPNYRHHKPFTVAEISFWLKAGLRKIKYGFDERRIIARLLSSDGPRFFLVALQVYNDSQIRVHSPWKRIEDFIEWTIFSFATYAPETAYLVIKHHPMDRGHRSYAPVIAALAAKFGVAMRVLYVHDVHLPSLLRGCAGVVTVNSTVGLQALYHGVPVMALGRSFYGKRGITYQGSLDAFWGDPGEVDANAFRRFRNYLIQCSQINSSFYADENVCEKSTKNTFTWEGALKVLVIIASGAVAAYEMSLLDMALLTSALKRVTEWFVDRGIPPVSG